MKNLNKKIQLYIVIVIIPFFITSIIYMNYMADRDFQWQKDKATQTAVIMQKQWDTVINKTMTSLNTLSLSFQSSANSMSDNEKLLKKVLKQEQSYGGIYLLDKTGNVLIGSNDTYDNLSLGNDEYLKEVIETKDTVISDQTEILSNGQNVVGMGKPILNEQRMIENILLVYLRVDHLQNIMRILSPNQPISIVNSENEYVMDINEPVSSENENIYLPIERLPWKIVVEVGKTDALQILQKSIIFIVCIFICWHVLYFVLLFNILRKKSLQEKKQNELQKLELVGNLAASSAHEIRNPLTGIKGLVQLLSEKYKEDDDQFYFSIIQKEINRINEIVSQFLILGKPADLKMQRFNLISIIDELKPLIISEANLYNVECFFEVPKHHIPIFGNEDQMKQVILNITKNALEAMEKGGELRSEITTLQNQVKITILDTGQGIPTDQLKKIFEPFYTSKATGTGLGLIVCKRIIDSFNGNLYVTSKEDIGTKVDILLPVMQHKK